MTSNVGTYQRGNIYDVTDRTGEAYVNNNFAVYVEKEEKAAVESKEEKVVIETKEAKPKKQVKAPK